MQTQFSIQKLRTLPAAAVAILLLHLVASLALPSNGVVTYAAVLLCNTLAFFACLRRSRASGGLLRARWRLVGLFFFFNYFGVFLLHLHLAILGVPKFGIGVPEFVAMLRAVPLILAVVLPESSRVPTQDSTVSLWIASAQTLLFIGLAYHVLFFVHPFGLIATLPGALFPTTETFIAEFAILAAAYTLRLIARSSPRWTTFYLSLTFYLWGLACVSFFASEVIAARWHAPAGSPAYLAFDAVILLFAVYVGRPRPAAKLARSSTVYLNLAGPVVFPLVNFVLAAMVARVQFDEGIAIMGFSLALFAIRTTSLQTGYRRMQEQLLEDNQLTMLEARVDQLTGIPNRRSFDRTLDREWRRAERTHQPLGLLMVDVDKFKHLNDTQGHPAGDRTLKRIAGVLDARLTRATDFVARYGGEEFSVILTDTSVQDIKAIAESLRLAVAEARLPNETDIGPIVSISIGAALTYPAPPLTPSSLLSGADQALYQAKRNGRNRVEFTNLLDAPSARAQTDGALDMLISNYKDSLYGPEADPLEKRAKKGKSDRRIHEISDTGQDELEVEN